jgi:DNA polymerase
MYHPAAALHQGSLRQIIETDMVQIPRVLAQFEKMTETPVEAQQLNLL